MIATMAFALLDCLMVVTFIRMAFEQSAEGCTWLAVLAGVVAGVWVGNLWNSWGRLWAIYDASKKLPPPPPPLDDGKGC